MALDQRTCFKGIGASAHSPTPGSTTRPTVKARAIACAARPQIVYKNMAPVNTVDISEQTEELCQSGLFLPRDPSAARLFMDISEEPDGGAGDDTPMHSPSMAAQQEPRVAEPEPEPAPVRADQPSRAEKQAQVASAHTIATAESSRLQASQSLPAMPFANTRDAPAV